MKLKAVNLGRAAVSMFGLFLTGPLTGGDASAQSVKGILREEGSQRPIPTAAVLLLDTAGVTVETTLTSRDGHFTVDAPDAGSYSLSAAAIGYARATTGVFELTGDQLLEIELELRPSAITLPGIRIEVERARTDHFLEAQGFYNRQKRGNGYFFTSEDIEKIDPFDFQDIFLRVPGVRVVDGGWRGTQLLCASSSRSFENSGPERPRVYLDGFRVPSSNLRTLTQVRNVAAIEVYKGGASLPLEFPALGSSCVIVVWTKG